MTITEFGRVELDITKVPISTLASKHGPERFEDQLSDARHSHPIDTTLESERVDPRNPKAPEANDTAVGDRDEVVRDTDRANDDGAWDDSATEARDDAAEVQDPAAPQDTTSQHDRHQAYSEEGPVRRAAAGKDPGPSSSFLAQGGQGQASQVPSDGGMQMALGGTGTGQQPQAQPQSQGQDSRAVAEAFRIANHPTAKQSTAPVGYRTVNAARLAAAEAARDSVIKQIALEIGPDGGRMRVHLNPPELGRLDIHMVVEKGAVIQLSIAVERPEVLMMLNKDLSELRQLLAQQGLDMSGTDVQTSLFEHRDHGDGSRMDHGNGPVMGQDAFEVDPTLHRVGYVTAEGLDFWV